MSWAMCLAALSAPAMIVVQPEPVTLEVRIPSERDVTLAGALRLPARRGRHPVLLVQSGSGEQRRGAYDAMQDRLNRLGIATLSFDKRGVGASTGQFTDTMDEVEADLLAAIRWLRTRPDIDGTRIALLGHSQGAAAAPVVAERDGKLAAIVMLAGPVGARGTMFLTSMRAELIRGGNTPAAADRITTAARDWFEARGAAAPTAQINRDRAVLVQAFADGTFTPDQAEAATLMLDNAAVLSMYHAAPGTSLSKLRIPVLALVAGRDEHVDTTAATTSAALAENPDALVIEVPGAGHVMTYRPASAPARTNPEGGRWLLPEWLIEHWLMRVLHVRAGT